ncbi:MAG: adenosylcobinamide-phosphate synthase CbiB [Blautia sp.]|nr:adenosylcobinamide-phosphate synthase CbiB [Blautia sp.]MCM1202138.1 adenosylcobinamide-phosphate synthase CbiB [Bacteroides fragilis]
MRYHIIAFLGGFLWDLILGDPQGFPHPVRLIGKLISAAERKLRAKARISALWQGIALVVIVLAGVTIPASFLLLAAYRLHPFFGTAVECLMTYQLLAVKSLKVESMKVFRCLERGDLEQARAAVSMIVGRDTECLDEEGVAKAAVETVAENTSDGVVAPMLYLAFGGPVSGFFYKAVNTMDSMVGYRNEEYLYFGRAAAKLDDFMNYIPARISALLMIAVSFFYEFCERHLAGRFLGDSAKPRFSGRRAAAVYRRDRKKHASPNSAQTESVCAGALGIRLAGDARYFGKIVRKPYIGDALRKTEYEDIGRADRLLYGTAWLCEVLCLCLLLLLL